MPVVVLIGGYMTIQRVKGLVKVTEKEKNKGGRPRIEITQLQLDGLYKYLGMGLSLLGACRASGCVYETIRDRIKKDADFKRAIEKSIAVYDLKVHKTKIELIDEKNVVIVKSELDRLHKRDEAESYKGALMKALQKVIGEGDFMTAKLIQKELDGQDETAEDNNDNDNDNDGVTA